MRTLKRRRREGKTDYLKRLKLLKSNSPRIVFRKTNRYIIAQCIISHEAQDKSEMGVVSNKLEKYGWPKEFEGSLKSVPASYLTGLLLGKNIIKEKIKSPIVDLGMIRAIGKSKVFAFIKGLIDSGVEIKCDESNFPDEERISGKNMKKDFSKIFSEIKSRIESDEQGVSHSNRKSIRKEK